MILFTNTGEELETFGRTVVANELEFGANEVFLHRVRQLKDEIFLKVNASLRKTA